MSNIIRSVKNITPLEFTLTHTQVVLPPNVTVDLYSLVTDDELKQLQDELQGMADRGSIQVIQTENASQILAASGAGGGGLTFPILAPDGIQSAPSYSFASEPGTGVFLDGAKYLALDVETVGIVWATDDTTASSRAGNLGSLIWNNNVDLVMGSTGQIQTGIGTAANPTINITSQQGLGLFKADTQKMGIAAGGVEVARFSAAGLSIPTDKKVILGNSDSAFVSYSNAHGTLYAQSDSSNLYLSAPQLVEIFANTNSDGTGSFYPSFRMDQGGAVHIENDGSQGSDTNRKFHITLNDGLINGDNDQVEFERTTGNHFLTIGYTSNGSSETGAYLRSRVTYPLRLGTEGTPNAMSIANAGDITVTTHILNANGSSATPSYSFSSNPSYGIYLNPSNPSVNITANGVDQIVVSNGETDIQTSFVDMTVDQFFVEGITSGKSIVTDTNSNIALGISNLTTSSTDGFPQIPVVAGTPVGTPTVLSGHVPFCADSSGSKLWVYIGGAWKSATLS